MAISWRMTVWLSNSVINDKKERRTASRAAIFRLSCFFDEKIDLIGDGGKALTPEIGLGEVDTCNTCYVFYGVHGCCLQKRAIFRKEGFALFHIFCVKTAGEESAEGVGEVIIAESCAVIVALTAPHIGMQEIRVKSIAEGFLLGIEHDLTEVVCEKECVFSAANNFIFKKEAGLDIHDDLCHILKLSFDQADLFFALGVFDRAVYDDKLVEIRCRFCHGHSIACVERTVILDLLAVVSMTKLMSKRGDGAKGA